MRPILQSNVDPVIIRQGSNMVYTLQLLPTYLLHFTYGLSLGNNREGGVIALSEIMPGYPSILEPQLKSQSDSGIFLDSTSEGLVVSLDYGSTIFISVVAGWLQVSSLGSVSS